MAATTPISAPPAAAPLGTSIVNVAFYDIGKDFSNARTATLSWVVTAYTIGFGSLGRRCSRHASR